MLFLARRMLTRFPQPVDRIRLIQSALAAAMVMPVLLTLAPWPAWRWQVIEPVETQAVRVEHFIVPESTDLAPQDSLSGTPMMNLGPKPMVPEFDSAMVPVSVNTPAPFAKSASAGQWKWNEAWPISAWVIIAMHGFALFVYFIQWIVGTYQLHRCTRHAITPEPLVVEIWKAVTEGRSPNVRLLVSPDIDVPLMFGWLRPVVLIPQSLAERNGPALQYCLAHEWAHIERGDILTWRGVGFCQIFFWFIPSYWRLRKELRLCQDLLADQRSAANAVEYSELLMGFARKRMSFQLAGALTILDRPSHLSRRIKMLLESPVSLRYRCTWRFSILAAVMAGLFPVLISSVRIEAQQVDKDEAKALSTVDEAASSNDNQTTELKYTCRVIDKETGNDISGAEVTVRRSIHVPGGVRVLAETKHTTDGDGQYEFIIPPEQVAQKSLHIEVIVRHEKYALRSGGFDYLNSFRKNKKFGERPYFERMELYPGEEVSGTILSPDGQPLMGVDVYGFSAVKGRVSSLVKDTTVSGADGTFRFVFHKDGDAVIWVVPKDFAVIEKFLSRQRGDLGQIRLSPGVRLTGQVLDVAGTPVPGVFVNLVFPGNHDLGQVPVSPSTLRTALTDLQGRFMLDPVPPGEFQVSADVAPGYPFAMDWLSKNRRTLSLPAVFLPKRIRLTQEQETAVENIQAVPHIIFHAQNLDHHEQKTKGGRLYLYGRIDGSDWSAGEDPDQDGAIALMIPHGLQDVEVSVSRGAHSAVRYRHGKGQPLRDGAGRIRLGTLLDDVEDFEIVTYKAPMVFFSAFNEARQQIPKLTIKAKYATPQMSSDITFDGSDIRLERQTDGRYRTRSMLPDEDVTFTITADGYSSVEEKINLKEGETKELIVTLKKSTDGNTQ
jgi:beta-lactamase regulating signal transducer with metallopeptidase domain